jgi:hypothetical protein
MAITGRSGEYALDCKASCGGRYSRYRGKAKAHLRQVLIASAINFIRVDEWLAGNERAETRISHFARLQGVA